MAESTTLRVTVVTGGSTPEREVALAGAAQVVAALRGRGHEVTVVDTTSGALTAAEEERLLVGSVGRKPPSADDLAQLAARELGPAMVELPALRHAEVLFLVLHGRQGEGGELQALLDLAGLNYAGSGPLASGLAMDKDIAKRLMRSAGVPTADWVLWPAADPEVASLGLPVVVKPVKVGSTVGLTVVRSTRALPAALKEAGRFDDEVMLERFLPGRELTVGVLGDRPLAVGEIIPAHEIFDYECKYTPGMAREIFPADLPEELAAEIQQLGLGVHRALKLRDFSRVDFKLGEDGRPYCLEANTLPGVTSNSLLPQSGAAVGIPFEELCEEICRMAYRRRRPEKKTG